MVDKYSNSLDTNFSYPPKDDATVVCKIAHKISFLVHKWQFYGGRVATPTNFSIFDSYDSDLNLVMISSMASKGQDF